MRTYKVDTWDRKDGRVRRYTIQANSFGDACTRMSSVKNPREIVCLVKMPLKKEETA